MFGHLKSTPVMMSELYRVKKITSNFAIEIKRITNKYIGTGFPSRFAHSAINSFDDVK